MKNFRDPWRDARSRALNAINHIANLPSASLLQRVELLKVVRDDIDELLKVLTENLLREGAAAPSQAEKDAGHP